ncbi:MAG: ABC transporter ATP-binding protein [Bacilli bacterium]|nr:ABC transporter ATP-binding protein [Bacilli bacterium]
MPKPMTVTEKPKNFNDSIKKLFKSLNNWKYFLVLSLILAFISAVLSLIAPNRLTSLTDTITLGIKPNISEKIIEDIFKDENISDEDKIEFKKLIETSNDKDQTTILNEFDKLPDSIYKIVKPKMNITKIKNISLLLAILYIVSALFNFIESFIMTTISNKYAKKLRNEISVKINKLPLKFFDTHETGDILSRITNDVDTIAQNLNHSLATLVTSLTLFIGSILMMFITNYIMAFTAIISSIIGFIFMGIIMGKSQKWFVERQTELGNLNGFIEEMYNAHNIVKVYNGIKKSNEDFDILNDKLYESNRKSQFLSGIMQPLMMFIGNFGYVAVCVVGALLTMNNIISFGVIVAFMVYVRLFTNPLSQIAQAMTSLQSVAASSDRVFEFLEEKELTKEKTKIKLNKTKVKGEIEFKNVKFGYDENRTIIKDFSVKIKPGSKVAIVGPTGAGKTTIVNLLMKFYEINSGDILIDGVSIKELSRENIHDLFIMVLQDTWLFEGTIKENLIFNKEKITDEEIVEACEKVGVYHFIKTLPGSLESNVNNNDSISSGQKQLLTITRGMIKNAPFLILDEATSNVDTRTEELVQKAMDKLLKGKTSFIIAHRLSTIKNADLILVMKDGNIIEQGNHNSLIKKNGFYAELYNSQFKNN